MSKDISDCFGKDGNISLNDDFRLPYVQAVLEEVMRSYPLITLGVARFTNEDLEINGCTIEKGNVQKVFYLGLYI